MTKYKLLLDFNGVLENGITTYWSEKYQKTFDIYVPMPGAQEAIARLSKYFEIIVVTAAARDYLVDVQDNIKYYYPEVSAVINTWRKDLIMGDIQVDDSPSMLGGNYAVPVLFEDRPPVIKRVIKHNFHTVKNWRECEHFIMLLYAAFEEQAAEEEALW